MSDKNDHLLDQMIESLGDAPAVRHIFNNTRHFVRLFDSNNEHHRACADTLLKKVIECFKSNAQDFVHACSDSNDSQGLAAFLKLQPRNPSALDLLHVIATDASDNPPSFLDAWLAGFYANRHWAAMTQSPQTFVHLCARFNASHFMQGVYAAEDVTNEQDKKKETLFYAMCDKIPPSSQAEAGWENLYKTEPPAWASFFGSQLAEIIEAVHKLATDDTKPSQYAQARQMQAAWKKQWRERSRKQGVWSARILWGLTPPSDRPTDRDANYATNVTQSVRVRSDESLEESPSDGYIGFLTLLQRTATNKNSDAWLNALKANQHTLIVGEGQSGKTLHRIYLQYHCLRYKAALPVLYQPPRKVREVRDVTLHLEHLARAVSNEMAATLIEGSLGDFLKEKGDIRDLFTRFSYEIEDDTLCLPKIPPDLIGIQERYSHHIAGGIYQLIPKAQSDQAVGVDALLTLKQAMQAMERDSSHIFVLIDNLDTYADVSGLANPIYMLASIADKLSQHGLFLKVFVRDNLLRSLRKAGIRVVHQMDFGWRNQRRSGKLLMYEIRGGRGGQGGQA